MDLNKIIGNFSCLQKKMLEGEAYYKGQNTEILERRKQFYNVAKHAMEDDYTKANNTLPSGFTKMIVDQKVSYSINNDMTIESDGIENLIDVKKFKRQLGKIGKQASNKIYGVMCWYIKDNELKFKTIPSEQIIIIRNKDDDEIVDYIVRPWEYNGEKYCDVYKKDVIEYYVYEDGDYKLTLTEPNLLLKGNNTEDKEEGWGRVPITILYNNDEMQRDLDRFKFDTDCYDVVKSDLCNNLEDFNESYWILRGYNGQDAEEFISEFKRSRIMKVGADGDASQESQDTPYQARETTLKILKRDIFRFAQAVDPEDIQGDVTNVAIESMYSQLDLKANEFEMEIQEFITESEYFINRYAEITGKQRIEPINVKFDRSMIINRDARVKLSNESIGSVSNQTRWEDDPRVKDTEVEKERVEEENKGKVDLE